ncbi:MAG TPA: hypothetical protein VEF55_08960 [Candidatus Binatia bacterium]|nr:hypothetical protein [Candidatus Binatia bacterium]
MGAALPWLVEKTWVRFRQKPDIVRVFGLDPVLPKLFIPCTVPSETLEQDEFERLTTAYEGIFVFDQLQRLFSSVGDASKTARVVLSDAVDHADLSDNVVLIGGPIFNSLSRDLLLSLAPKCAFDGHALVCAGDSERRFEPQGDPKDGIRDYALVVCTESIWESGKRCFAIMGCRTFGNMGASWALRDRKFRASIADRVRAEGNPNWIGVIGVSARRRSTTLPIFSAPRLEHWASLQTKT